MQAKARASKAGKPGKTDAGSVATLRNDPPQKQQGKKRSAAEAEDVANGTAADSPKRQKKVGDAATEADLQVCTGSAGHCCRYCRTTHLIALHMYHQSAV